MARIAQDAGGRDGRDVAAEADDERDERLARQADGAHDAVGDHGGAGHVTGVLQHRQAQEHQGHQRREGQHHAHAADEPVDDQPRRHRAAEPDGLHAGAHPVGDRAGDQRFQSILQGCGDDGGDLEDNPHHPQEQQRSGEGVEGDAVDAVRPGDAGPAVRGGGGDDAVDEGEAGLVGGVGVGVSPGRVPGFRARPDDAGAAGHGAGDGRAHVIDSGPAARVDGDDGHAQRPLHGSGVDVQALCRGDVDLGQHHDEPVGMLGDLGEQVQAAGRGGRVDRDDHQIRAFAFGAVDQHLAGELLVGTHRVEGVGAGEIDDVVGDVVGLPCAAADFHGGAGPVAHLRLRAGEGVEQRRLSGVGGTDQTDHRGARGCGRAIGAGVAAGSDGHRGGAGHGGAAGRGGLHRSTSIISRVARSIA